MDTHIGVDTRPDTELLDLAPVGLGVLDDELRYVWVNSTLADINGFPAEAHPGKPVADVVPAGLFEQLEPIYRSVLDRGEATLGVDLGTRGHPDRRWLANYFPVSAGGRTAVGVMVVELTARKRAEHDLRMSEERFRSLFDNALVGMQLIHPGGRIFRSNPASCRILGRTEKELRALDMFAIVHRDDRERSTRCFERLVRGDQDAYEVEQRYVHPDGSVVWVALMVAAVRSAEGDLRFVVTQLLDRTDMHAAEERLRQSEAQLAKAQEVARLGSWDHDHVTDVATWSDQMYRVLGYEPGEVPPGSASFFARVHPDDREAVGKRMAGKAARRVKIEFPLRVVHPGGAVRSMTSICEPVFDGAGNLVRHVGTLHDVTERDRREAERAAVAELDRHAVEGRSVAELAREAVEIVATILDVRFCGVAESLPGGDLVIRASRGWPASREDDVIPATTPSVPGEAVRLGRPVVIDDWESERRLQMPPTAPGALARSAACVPILTKGGTFGMLGVLSTEPRRFGVEDVDFLQAVAGALAAAIERRRADEEIAALAAARGRLVAQALDAEEATRRRISEMLHDHSLQELLAARQDLAEAAADPQRAAEHATRARAGVERAIRQLREAVADLHPVLLEHGGLASAIAAVAEHQAGYGRFGYELNVDPEVTGPHDTLILAIVRELLTNVAKHAVASSATVDVRVEAGAVVVSVTDDGIGAEPARLEAAVREGHIGLASLAQRVEAVGGAFEVVSRTSGGTTGRAVLPL